MSIEYSVKPPARKEFVVYAEPCAMPRYQITRTGGRYLKAPKGMKEHPALALKQRIALAARQAGMKPIDGSVRLNWIAYFSRPKNMMGKKFADTVIWKTTKPDQDNISKLIFDALNGIAYVDDAQVCAGQGQKFYCAKPGFGIDQPGIWISIEQIGGGK
jgi:Holliday junction resolvase RusA-like endonuclease